MEDQINLFHNQLSSLENNLKKQSLKFAAGVNRNFGNTIQNLPNIQMEKLPKFQIKPLPGIPTFKQASSRAILSAKNFHDIAQTKGQEDHSSQPNMIQNTNENQDYLDIGYPATSNYFYVPKKKALYGKLKPGKLFSSKCKL